MQERRQQAEAHPLLSRSWELLSQSGRAAFEHKQDALHDEPWEQRATLPNGAVAVSMFVSRRTGLRVYVADVDSPAIFGLWCVKAPTEGLPLVPIQTLARTLLELGSEQFRTPGLMQAASFRTLTQIEPVSYCPTNFAFSMLSISPEGFLDILPVLADTVMFPDWDSQKSVDLPFPRRNVFDTVVNTFFDHILHQESPASREVSWDRIRELHRTAFRAENMALIVCGHVDASAILEAIDEADVKYATLKTPLATPANSGSIASTSRVVELFFEGLQSDSLRATPIIAIPEPTLVQTISPAGIKLVRSEVPPFWQTWPWARTVMCMLWPVPAASRPVDIMRIRALWRYLVEGNSAPLRLAVVNNNLFWPAGPIHEGVIEHHVYDGPPSLHGIVIKVESPGVVHLLAETLQRAIEEACRSVNMARIKKVLRHERLKYLDTAEESAAPKLSSELMQCFLSMSDGQTEDQSTEIAWDSTEVSLAEFERLPSDESEDSERYWQATFRSLLLERFPACLDLSAWVTGESGEILKGSEQSGAAGAASSQPPSSFGAGSFHPSDALSDAKLVTSMIIEEPPSTPTLSAEILREVSQAASMEDTAWMRSAALTDVTSMHATTTSPIFDDTLLASSTFSRVGKASPRPAVEQEEDLQILPQVTRPLGKRLAPATSVEQIPLAPLPVHISCSCVSVTCIPVGGAEPSVQSSAVGVLGQSRADSVLEYLRSKGLVDPTDANCSTLPFVIQFDHIWSSFVEVSIWIDTTDMPDDLRPFLELFLEIVFASPTVSETGARYSVDDLTYALRQDLTQYSTSIGTSASNFICGAWAQCACVTVKSEASKYAMAVAWLHRLLFLADFDVESLKLAAAKLLRDAHDRKRDSSSIAYALTSILNYDVSSNHSATNFISQLTFLAGVLQKLNTNPAAVLSILSQMKHYLTSVDKMRVHVSGNVFAQTEPVRPWQAFSSHVRSRGTSAPLELSPVVESRALRSSAVRSPEGKLLIVDCGSDVDCCVCVTIPIDIGYHSAELPVLLATMEYLATPEGELNQYLQRTVGGDCPLLRCHPEQGIIMLTLYGANDVAKALDACRTVLQALAGGRLPINKRLLEDVVHTLLIELVERAASPMRSGLQCFYDLLRGVGHNYNLAFARRLRGVTAQHVQECISHTILSLFGPSTAVIICCAAGLAVPIRRSLQGRTGNRRVEMLTLKDCIQRAVLPSESNDDTISTASSDANSSLGAEMTSQKTGWLSGYYDAICRTAKAQPLQLVALSAAVATASVALLMAGKKS